MSLLSVSRLFAITSLGLVSAAAFADPTCTKEPESSWIPFEQAQQQVEEMDYKIKVFKVTKTGCYELYGHDKDSKRVEIYFNPTNMEKVKEEKDG
ncbi:PepSY domain-containing protein [Vibrio mimicus]